MLRPKSSTALRAGERSRRVRTVGVVLILSGLVVLGYVGWQYYGTTILSHRKQQQITADLERRWRAGHDTAGVPVASSRAEALIRIPRFGSDYAVPVLEGTSDAVLDAGFGHFAGSVGPGGVGNYALAAHRVTHGEPLRDMPSLRKGDQVFVETRRATYVYVLDTGGADLVVPFTETWVIDPVPRNPHGGVGPGAARRLLTLTTCAELFHTDDRMVAFGHLRSVRRK